MKLATADTINWIRLWVFAPFAFNLTISIWNSSIAAVILHKDNVAQPQNDGQHLEDFVLFMLLQANNTHGILTTKKSACIQPPTNAASHLPKSLGNHWYHWCQAHPNSHSCWCTRSFQGPEDQMILSKAYIYKYFLSLCVCFHTIQ